MRGSIFRGMAAIAGTLAALELAAALIYFAFFPSSGLPFTVMYFAAFTLTAILTGVALAAVLSARITEPLRSGGEEVALRYKELEPFLMHIRSQRSQIRDSAFELEEKTVNLRMVTEFMREGLILLDSRELIISLNRAARDLFGLPDVDYAGRHILAANSNEVLQAAVHAAVGGVSSEETFSQGESVLQLMANPVIVEGVVRGVVLLVFDITEREAAEQMRREFSANVSHELKTPLTSIFGYAEIMKDGLVKPKDMGRFAATIYAEASRLIALVDDIMKLSRLDEGSSELSRERVSLMGIARDAASRLEEKAAQMGVELRVTGEDAKVFGNAQILDEMLVNLLENAIKYNKPGGEVVVRVGAPDGYAVLAVRDTGIGIPREHIGRVFERFYRVDRSHSKQTGGTGLGLSIVKHGAIFHDAEVELASRPGEGTTVTLRFENDMTED